MTHHIWQFIRRRSRFIALLVLLAAAAVVLGTQILPQPPVRSAPALDIRVGISDPAAGLIHVRLSFPADALRGRPYLDLSFRDLRRAPEQLKSISASAGGRPLEITRPFWKGGHERRILLDGSGAAVAVEYTLDPTFFAPGQEVTEPADADSRLAAELGILRTTAAFPAVDPGGWDARIAFDLPMGWQAVTPWRADGGGYLVPSEDQAVEYIAVGPFQVEEVRAADMALRVATIPGEALSTETIRAVWESELAMMGKGPAGTSEMRSIIVVPRGFLNGGSAGRASIVQLPQPDTLAHEMFHWWNSNSPKEPNETGWFREGFTEYYGVQLAVRAGAWRTEDARACLADLNAEMRYLEGDRPRGLADVSRQSTTDSHARRLMYAKGALLASLMDARLTEAGRGLDELMRAVVWDGEGVWTNARLKTAVHTAYAGTMDEMFADFVDDAAALPAFDFGPSDGSSGCARYLPE